MTGPGGAVAWILSLLLAVSGCDGARCAPDTAPRQCSVLGKETHDRGKASLAESWLDCLKEHVTGGFQERAIQLAVSSDWVHKVKRATVYHPQWHIAC